MRLCLLASRRGDQNTARMTGGYFHVGLSISGQRTLFLSIGLVTILYSTVQHPHKHHQSPLSHNPRLKGPEATLHCKSDHVTWRRESDGWAQWLNWG